MIVTSSLTSPSSKPSSLSTKTCFLFYLTHQVQYLLPLYSCMCGLSLKYDQLTGGVTHQENWLSISWQLSTASSFLAMGGTSYIPSSPCWLRHKENMSQEKQLKQKITMEPAHFCTHSFLKVTEQRILIVFPSHLPQGRSGRIRTVIALKTGES